tara:strand:- start:301 stop:744 length:444 start_codon:yes stop_codon:yes gene_type:complete
MFGSIDQIEAEMDLGDFPVFRMMKQKLGWLNQRQRVIAENIANADTPNYRAQDLKQIDFRKLPSNKLFSSALSRTHEGHIKGSGTDQSFRINRENADYEINPSGNSVVLEEQMLKSTQNAGDHQLVTSLYRKHMSLFRIALGRGAGR